jgi:lysine 6-dehydrogenase
MPQLSWIPQHDPCPGGGRFGASDRCDRVSDLTVMRLIISGVENGKPATYTYDMYDEYDPATVTLSMARTTGYTCTAVTRLVLEGGYSQKGISPPEFVGRVDGCWESVGGYLKDRGVHCKMKRS